VTVKAGRDAVLNCVVKNLGEYKVSKLINIDLLWGTVSSTSDFWALHRGCIFSQSGNELVPSWVQDIIQWCPI
jgi:hypothetical protein